jgi:hypothetical protein
MKSDKKTILQANRQAGKPAKHLCTAKKLGRYAIFNIGRQTIIVVIRLTDRQVD